MVQGLTNTSKITNPEMNRAGRKELDRQKMLSCSPRVQFIKLADIYDNLGSVEELGGFGKKFLNEKAKLVESIEEQWNARPDIVYNKERAFQLLDQVKTRIMKKGGALAVNSRPN
jgi:hypothetical protein